MDQFSTNLAGSFVVSNSQKLFSVLRNHAWSLLGRCWVLRRPLSSVQTDVDESPQAELPEIHGTDHTTRTGNSHSQINRTAFWSTSEPATVVVVSKPIQSALLTGATPLTEIATLSCCQWASCCKTPCCSGTPCHLFDCWVASPPRGLLLSHRSVQSS